MTYSGRHSKNAGRDRVFHGLVLAVASLGVVLLALLVLAGYFYAFVPTCQQV